MIEKVQPLTDLTIANQAIMQPITKIAEQSGIPKEAIEPYGNYKAKIDIDKIEKSTKKGKVILVTATSPTPAGEGKSTVTVGLSDAMRRLGKKTMIALREPSLGPVMGIKGGATGGGYAQVLPMEDINLHFTGDLHAITTANNALSAFIDNHIHRGNELNIDPRRVIWKRVLDMNDRALRNIVVGLGGPAQGVPREDGFDITVASEIMAVFCLASNLTDLKERLAKIVIGHTYEKEPVTVRDLGVEGALTLLLKEAFKPNLVQTIEGTPALVHGGPFANIAHGCNSLVATNVARSLVDYVITEAGFGSDLGAEKFMNIKARIGEFSPNAVVIVTTVRALKMHGDVHKKELKTANVDAVEKGIVNLAKHIETIRAFGVEPIVSINRFITDSDAEVTKIHAWCQSKGIRVAVTEVWEHGGAGGLTLAKEVIDAVKQPNHFDLLYRSEDSMLFKLEKIVQQVYGGRGIHLTDEAKRDLQLIEQNGWESLPVCMAKTQYSFSDNPELLGRTEAFIVTIRQIIPKLGAGFLVCLTGDIMTMPGLPAQPAALNMDVDESGNAKGLM